MVNGVRNKAKYVTILLNNEEVYKDACTHLKTLLEVMASFGDEEVIEYYVNLTIQDSLSAFNEKKTMKMNPFKICRKMGNGKKISEK